MYPDNALLLIRMRNREDELWVKNHTANNKNGVVGNPGNITPNIARITHITPPII